MNKLSAWMYRLCSHSLCSYSSGNPGTALGWHLEFVSAARCKASHEVWGLQLKGSTSTNTSGSSSSGPEPLSTIWVSSSPSRDGETQKILGVVGPCTPCTPVSTFFIHSILYFFMFVNHWHSKMFPAENLSMPQNLREFSQIRSRLNPRENNISAFYCNALTLELPHENSFFSKINNKEIFNQPGLWKVSLPQLELWVKNK